MPTEPSSSTSRPLPNAAGGIPDPTERVDKWLWAVRVFKTRSLATDACRAGSVEIAGQAVKPARDVRAGETVVVRQGLAFRTYRVLAIPKSRVGPKLVATFSQDQTSPEEWAKIRERSVQQTLAREKGSGRPTKKERRDLEEFFE